MVLSMYKSPNLELVFLLLDLTRTTGRMIGGGNLGRNYVG